MTSGLKSLPGERLFRWRGGDVSRIESLTDAVFALSLTLLVVSLEVPRTFDELLDAFAQLPAFAICFAILVMCWFYHFQYHRRYGLEDFPTVVLNAVLVFLILFYVYPLKFLFSLLVGFGREVTLADGSTVAAISRADMPTLMLLYSGGFAAIFALFWYMTWRAWARRDELGLDPVERELTRGTLRAHAISVAIALASVAVALAAPSLAPVSGMVYFAMGPAHGINGYRTGRRAERLAEARNPVTSAASDTKSDTRPAPPPPDAPTA